MDTLAIVLSSTLISGTVSALIGGWFARRSKQDEYANAYFKMILERRVKAYEGIEALIDSIKTVVVGDDDRPYHLLFSRDDGYQQVFAAIQKAMSALWLSDELFQQTRELNLLCYSKATEKIGLIEFGKQHYTQIADLRTKMERTFISDMLMLHDVPGFLKSKRPRMAIASYPRAANKAVETDAQRASAHCVRFYAWAPLTSTLRLCKTSGR